MKNENKIEERPFSNTSLSGKCFINSGEHIWGDLFDESFDFGPDKLFSARRIYFRRVMQAVLKNVNNADLVFYICFDLDGGIYKLPSYGDNVVSLIVGDESYRIPLYINRVAAIFKSQGVNPTYLLNGLSKTNKFSFMNFLVFLHFLKSLRRYLPTLLNYLLVRLRLKHSKHEEVAPIYDIPLGYGSQIDLPLKDINERTLDVFFGGSILHRKYSVYSPKTWLSTHKRLSREKMMQSASQIREKHPEWIFETLTRDTYEETTKLSIHDGYSENMMNSKICLVPRGVTLDTCRLFEALRYGCIIITDSLPSTWFYDGMPIIKVEAWQELEGKLQELLSDQTLLKHMHDATINWWNEKCSEESVGKFIANKINSLKENSIHK